MTVVNLSDRLEYLENEIEKIKKEVNFSNKQRSWKEIQALVRNGEFERYYEVGDTFNVMYKDKSTEWTVVAIDVAIPANGSFKHSVTLMPVNVLDCVQFDSEEIDNDNPYRKNYGNNNYGLSAIRQWLNSWNYDWWRSQHSCDNEPNYTDKAGFMSNFENDFLEVLGMTKIENKVADCDGGDVQYLYNEYFYLPSEEEVGFIQNEKTFPYFNNNIKRIKKDLGDRKKYWWLRTPYYSNSYLVRNVHSDGTRYSHYAYYSLGVAPACNII